MDISFNRFNYLVTALKSEECRRDQHPVDSLSADKNYSNCPEQAMILWWQHWLLRNLQKPLTREILAKHVLKAQDLQQ